MSTAAKWRFPSDRKLSGSVPAPTARTTGALLDEQAAANPDAEVLVCGGVRWTYGELCDRAWLLARGLLASGVGKGDHVAILMGNRPEWIAFWMAINAIGATVVGVSTWSSTREFEYVLRHSDARALIAGTTVGERDLAAVVRETLERVGWTGPSTSSSLPALGFVEIIDTTAEEPLASMELRGEKVDASVCRALSSEVRGVDVALLLYTSGSSSTPKGVRLIHRTLIEHGYDIGESLDLRPGDRYWLPLPLFWSAGSANTSMAVLSRGATLVLQESFDPDEAARLLRDERCTHYFAFPNITAAVSRALGDNQQLPTPRVAVTPGQSEAIELLQKMGFESLVHPYGTTEDYGFATITDLRDPVDVIMHSQGLPLPGIEVRIADPTTHEFLASGNIGEIWLKGNVTPGYYKDEDKNQSSFDDDGFFHTGDVGLLDETGRLSFQGRIGEMIKTSGFNVAPAEVEAVLLQHPNVAEAYVIGTDDEQRGEAIVAFVRLRSEVTGSDLRMHCRTLLSSYKVPHHVFIETEFPITATGKVSKRALADLAPSRLGRVGSP